MGMGVESSNWRWMWRSWRGVLRVGWWERGRFINRNYIIIVTVIDSTIIASRRIISVTTNGWTHYQETSTTTITPTHKPSTITTVIAITRISSTTTTTTIKSSTIPCR